jgi:hypothetical protein
LNCPRKYGILPLAAAYENHCSPFAIDSRDVTLGPGAFWNEPP